MPKIDLIMGGSPCQGFSFAGKGLNFNDPRSKLFFEFVRLRKELMDKNPRLVFFLENVKMKKEHELLISKYLGVNPIEINSALVSAQNRIRLYWTNINEKPYGFFGDMAPDIPQPKDKGILLKDILEINVAEKYYISNMAIDRINRTKYSKPKFNPEKTGTLTTKNNSGQLSVDSGTTLIKCVAMRGRNPQNPKSRKSGLETEQMLEARNDEKTNCLTSVQKDNLIIQVNPSTESGGNQPYQQNRIYDVNGICPALLADMSSGTHAILNESKIRRLTPVECERLQTVPDNYTACVSDTQRYRMLGNGWNVDTIVHFFKHLKL